MEFKTIINAIYNKKFQTFYIREINDFNTLIQRIFYFTVLKRNL